MSLLYRENGYKNNLLDNKKDKDKSKTKDKMKQTKFKSEQT